MTMSQNPFSGSLSQDEKAFAQQEVSRKLNDFLAQITRKDLYYCRKPIHLDGLTFDDCSFENCAFYTKSGQFSLRNCRIYGPETTFYFEGPALKVVRIHELLHYSHTGQKPFPQFLPQFDNDGKITIV